MEVKAIFLSALGATTAGGVAVGGYYFAKPKYIKDLLLKDGMKLLDTSESSSKDDEHWNKLVAKHSDNQEPIKLKENKEVKRLVISGTSTKIDKNKLKEECKKLLNKAIDDKEMDKDKENAKNWCTKDSPLLDDKKLASASG